MIGLVLEEKSFPNQTCVSTGSRAFRRARRYFFLLTLLLAVVPAAQTAAVQTWTAYEWAGDYGPEGFVFTLDDSHILSVNRTEAQTPGGSSSEILRLLFSGEWGVCLAGDADRDPYALFVHQGDGVGRIEWASNTPAGYRTNLVLGSQESRFNPGVYQNYRGGVPAGQTVGTLVLWHVPWISPQRYSYHEPLTHTFVVEVPEPSLSKALSLLIVLPAVLTRKNRDRRTAVGSRLGGG